MSEAPTEPVVLIRAPETCVVHAGGALVSIRRAVLTPHDLERFRRAVDAVASTSPGGLVLLAVFRLDPRFPIEVDFDADVGEFIATLRAVDRQIIAIASVLEFGGVRAAAMRAVTRTVWRLGRPSSEMASFDRLADAASWIAPYAKRVNAPSDLGTYVHAYREADAHLRVVDAKVPA